MSVQKDKTLSVPGIIHPSKSHVNQGFLESQFITVKKVDTIPHSAYYLFDDDEDTLTTIGRKLSEYIAPRKSVSPKGNG